MSFEDIVNDLHRSPHLSLQEIFQVMSQIQGLNQPIDSDALARFILYEETTRKRLQAVRIGQDVNPTPTKKRNSQLMLSDHV
jgi:hypothetical protein